MENCEADSRSSKSPEKQEKGERAFIDRLARELPPIAGPMAFGDDLATLEARPGGLLWTTDMLMEGVDFESARHRWYEIGYKAMAVNISDCAACATVPVAALCAVALSDRLSMDDAIEILRGTRDCAAEFHCPVTGGDTNSWAHPTVICIAVAAQPDGELPPVRRGGAQVGDRVYVTGPVGGSLLGRHLHPEPRVELALDINRKLKPHAMIDISDGLAIDLWHVCEASACGALLHATELDQVIHSDARRRATQTGRQPREHALYDGEDFELIVVLSADVPPADACALGLQPLGEIIPEQTLVLKYDNGRQTPLEIRGWEHFREHAD